MSNINIKSDMGGGNSLNIIRLMSYKIYNDVILTGTLNGTISSSSFNWNRNDLYVPLQNNTNNACCFVRGSGEEYYSDKNRTSHEWYENPFWYSKPYGTRLIIEYKE